MENKNGFSRIGFSEIFFAAGAALILIGGLLKGFDVAPKTIYDLSLFLVIIGVGLVVYGIVQLLSVKRHGNTVYISAASVKSFFLSNVIIFALIVMVLAIAFIEPKFLQIRVLRDILSQSSTRLIIALGICFALIIGGTDLSAGRSVGLAAVVSASMMQTVEYGHRFFPNLPQIPVILPVIMAIIACMIFGLFNGFLVSRFEMPPFIATLAVMSIIYGSNSLYFDMKPNASQPIGGIRPDFSALGQTMLFKDTKYFGIPILIPIAIVVAIIIWFVLNKTVFGKNVYAIGGNKQAAIVSGINVPITVLVVFVVAAALYGIGGVLEASRTAGAGNNYGYGYELDAIAACVVGGVSLNGGVGKISGIIIGVLIFTVIQYGLSFIGLNAYWQQILKGIIIAVAVAIDMSRTKSK